jgi:hypothetical protein
MTTQHEVEQRVAGRGAIRAYLGQIFGDFDHTGARMNLCGTWGRSHGSCNLPGAPRYS